MTTDGASAERPADGDGSDEPLSYEGCLAILSRMPHLDVDAQLEAFERVLRFPDATIRRKALGIGASLLSDDRLVDFLRDGADDVRRNAGIEMLKLRRRRAFNLAKLLLDDADDDVGGEHQA